MRLVTYISSVLLTCGVARGSIIVDQPPQNTGGPAADTSFINDGGFSTWQRVADDIVLSQAATARHLEWFGFYGGDFSPPQFPPQNETIRVRFYDSRPGDGLPGQVLFDENFLNPSRIATGRLISGPGAQPEQRYEVDFAQPFEMLAGIRYWIEIVQIGDIESHLRWENSPGNMTPFAFINPNLADWRRTTQTANLSFELSSIPEPSAGFLALSGAAGLALTRPRARKK